MDWDNIKRNIPTEHHYALKQLREKWNMLMDLRNRGNINTKDFTDQKIRILQTLQQFENMIPQHSEGMDQELINIHKKLVLRRGRIQKETERVELDLVRKLIVEYLTFGGIDKNYIIKQAKKWLT